jgi:hypothetical protein
MVSDVKLPSFDGATEWIGSSSPMSRAAGRVVLVNFWTYTCINWLRSLPNIRAWDRSYADLGLLVIGVHTPEFPFEHNIDNVRRAVEDMGIDYPVAIDNEYAIWHEFDNHYWPATYIFDAQGSLRHYHFGEGGYDDSESAIQELLASAGVQGVRHNHAPVERSGIEASADWDNLKSQENYLGYTRTLHFESGPAHGGSRHRYMAPKQLSVNHWAITGDWVVTEQSIALAEPHGRIGYGFHARDVNLVMGPVALDGSVRFRVMIDGKPPGPDHGIDLDDAGLGVARDQRLYQLIRQQGPIVDRIFEIEFLDPGVEAFAFTFG